MAIDVRKKHVGIGFWSLCHSVLLNKGVCLERERAFSEINSQRGSKSDAADVRVRPGVPGPHRCYARQRTAGTVPCAQHLPRRATSCMRMFALRSALRLQ